MKAQRLRSILLPLLLLLTLAVAAHSAARAVPNPVPLVNNPLVPDAVAPGSQDFILTVNGTGFVSGSVVNWNGSPLATTFVNASQVTATVPTGNVATPGTASVTVANPGPGGGVSNAGLFTARTSFTAASFGRHDSPAGLFPALPVVADFNSDGKPDIAALAVRDSAVVILLGKGDGTFETSAEYPIRNSPEGLALGDFNGDGKIDLAVSDFSGFVSVLVGNGDGTFQARKDSPSGSPAENLTIADFDADGNLDVAVALGTGQVLILLGKGDGTFQSPVEYTAGSDRANTVIAGDFDGDGKLDLAVTIWSDDAVAVLLGGGDGTFHNAIEYPTQDGPQFVLAADLNGDGKLDLVVQTEFGWTSVLLGENNGTFATHVDYETQSGSSYVTAADVNGDGKVDIIVSNSATLSTFLGKGDGTFGGRNDFSTGGRPLGLTTGDFDGDGKLDLLTANSADNTVSVLTQVDSVLSRTYLKFGNVKAGTKSSRSVTLTNIGANSITITRIVIAGDSKKGYKQTNNCGPQLAPGASCKITIVFKPTFPVPYRHARVKINDSVADQKIYLTGSGVK